MDEEFPIFWLLVCETRLKILNEKLEFVCENEGLFEKAIQVSEKEIALIESTIISFV